MLIIDVLYPTQDSQQPYGNGKLRCYFRNNFRRFGNSGRAKNKKECTRGSQVKAKS